jgi:phospholipid transport system substrate-binding protein
MLRQAPAILILRATLLLKPGECSLRAMVLLLAALLAAAAAAQGAQPGEALMQSIADGLHILKDPYYQPAERKPLQQEKLRDVLYRDFDFTEFSRRVLADRWASFSTGERQEFVRVFARFLAEFYLSRLQQYYADETVSVREQAIVAPGKALVRAHVVWRRREFPVEIRLHDRDGSWKIYDLSALGISAVQVYRAQFQEILRTRSPAQVIELIKARLEER